MRRTNRSFRPGRIALENRRLGLPVGETPRQQTERVRQAEFARKVRASLATS